MIKSSWLNSIFSTAINIYFWRMSRLKNWKIILIHIFLWIGYGALLLNWLSFGYLHAALPLVIRTLIIQAILFYINVGILLPKLIDRNKYVLYVLSVFVIVIAAIMLYDLSNDLSIIRNAALPWRLAHRPRPHFGHGRRLLIGPWLFTNLFSFLAVLFISTIYWIIIQSRKRIQQALSMRNENLQTELKFLKSQINPHFLFNALNNIYSLSYTSSGKAPEMIMKLSGMLRYMLYDNNGRKASLRDEINYCKNYIDFQLLKLEGPLHILMQMDKADESLLVEPLLFIPFIENSFKHSNIDDKKNGWINMKLETLGSKIIFTISNSIAPAKFSQTAGEGIGLKNIKKRLELLYPEKHKLTIDKNENSFTVSLSLETK